MIVFRKREPTLDKLAAVLKKREIAVSPEGRRIDHAAPERRRAIETLVTRPGSEATELLAQCLFDPDEHVQLLALDALRARDGAGVGGALAARVGWLAAAPSERVRAHALDAVLERGDETSLGRVVWSMLERPEERPLAGPDRHAVRRLVGAGLKLGDPQATAAQLIPMLVAEQPTTCERASTILTWLGAAAIPSLLASLEEPSVKLAAIWMLGELRDATAMCALIELSADTDAMVRSVAVRALGKLRHPDCAAALLRRAHDDELEVRTAALDALDQLGTVGLAFVLHSQLAGLRDDADPALLAASVGASP